MVESTAAMARAVTRVVLWRSLIDVMESVTLCAKLCSQEIVYRILRRHPPLEAHATGAREFQPIAVRRQLAHRRCQPAVRPVERKELVQVRSEVHRLLDDLIRPQQQRGWDSQAERLGRLEINDKLKFRRLLDGQIARLRPLD